MKSIRTSPLALLLIAFCAITAVPAHAQITEDFSSYTVGDNAEFLGTIDTDWLSTWRSAGNNATGSGIIANTSPLNSGGNYLSGTVNTNAGTSITSATLGRAYNADTISSVGTSAYTMSFDFRADTATATERYDIFDSKVRASTSSTSATTWRVAAYDGKWYASDGSSSTLTDTGLAFAAGTTYSFDITQDPTNLLWGLTVTDGTTTESIADLATRTSTWGTGGDTTGGRWITFAASEFGTALGTTDALFSVDSIAIAAIPEPQAIALIFGWLALLPVMLRRRK